MTVHMAQFQSSDVMLQGTDSTSVYHKACVNNELLYYQQDVSVFVIYDETDDFTEWQLFPHFKKEKIRFCSLMLFPGKTTQQCLESLNPFPNKILIVLSEQFCKNERIKYTTECIIQFALFRLKNADKLFDNIITFITTGNISRRNGLSRLLRTNIIYNDSNTSLDLLTKEVRFNMPPFCNTLVKTDVSKTLNLHGLSIRHMESNIFGILILAQNQCLQIDLQEFFDFREKHKYLRTMDILGQYSVLRSPDTRVLLVLDNNADDYTDAKADIVGFCSSVIDGTTNVPETVTWSLACSITGKYSQREERLLTDLYPQVWSSVAQNSIRTITEPKFREFQEFIARKESFPLEWIKSDPQTVNKIAEAGFFYSGQGLNGCCFHCGSFLTNVKYHSDPLLKHASQYPDCRYIKQCLSTEEIKKATSKFNNNDDKLKFTSELGIKFVSFESRRQTFRQFESGTNEGTGSDNEAETSQYLDSLAAAGFYSLGIGDIIQCFRCCVRLFHIPSKTKNAWVTHAMISPACPYIIEMKGEQFIKDLQQSNEHALCPSQTIITFKRTLCVNNMLEDNLEYLFRPW